MWRALLRLSPASAFILILLAGCGGGGGGGGGGGSGGGGGGASAPANSFITPEFEANYALGRINAQSASARGATGQGVTVAVIDTGIDLQHPDLAPNVAANSTDITTGAPANVDDENGHGTLVSGVVAAAKNGVGVHGVAFDSRILAVKATRCPGASCGSFLDDDVAAAVNYAVAQGARVINLSLGGRAPDNANLQAALVNAASAGVIVVAASGNGGLASPDFPAANAGGAAFNGLLLAVGAVDRNNQAPAFNNIADGNASFFLVAPGVGIVTTANGGGYAMADGTSFAAPQVAGAAALLLQLFPSMTPAQIVQLLLTTATDLGDPGVDAVFGHGLLNLALASQPSGALVVPLTPSASGPTAPLEASRLSLGAAFGDALTGDRVLANAMMLDGWGRPFRTDLRQRLEIAGRGFRLEALLDGERARSTELEPAKGVRLSVASREDEAASLRDVLPFGQVEGPQRFESMSLAADLGRGARLALGYNLTPGEAVERPAAELGFWDSETLLRPGASLLGRGEGAALTQALGAATRLSLTVFEGREDEEAGRGIGAGSLAQAAFEHDVGPATLRFAVANVAEDEAFLGSEGDGAFAHGEGATSRFLTLGASLKLGERGELFGAWTSGSTAMPDGLGLLSDWGRVRSDSFGLGLAWRDVGEPGDRLGFLIGQPLRVREARATLTAPTAMAPDGSIQFASERTDLAPSGREIDLQAAYSHAPAPGWLASYYLMMQLEPGHDEEAEPAYGAAIKLKVGF
jgi:hypothetical protein